MRHAVRQLTDQHLFNEREIRNKFGMTYPENEF